MKNLKWKCTGCGTNYQAPEGSVPPGIKWSDGHICTPALIEDNKAIAETLVTVVKKIDDK